MSRRMIPIALVLLLTLIGIGDHAMAFTVRFGTVSVPDDAAAVHRTADADIPTPRLLNVAIGPEGLTFGPASTAPETPFTPPTIEGRSQTQPRVSTEPSRDRSPARPQQLSGVEIMLLQDANQVAAR